MKRANITLHAHAAERGAIPLESASPACVTFFVPGKPQPQGSMNAWVKNGRAIVTTANPALKAWRQAVGLTARAAGCRVSDAPASVKLLFSFKRPVSAPKSRVAHSVKPDLDKLVRAILDACTGISWDDDSRVVALDARKVYAEEEGVTVTIGR